MSSRVFFSLSLFLFSFWIFSIVQWQEYISSKQIFEDRNHLYLYCPDVDTDLQNKNTIENKHSECSIIDKNDKQQIDKLFTGLKENIWWWLNEDLQRYIWFGQRSFQKNNSIWRWLMNLIIPSGVWCYGRNKNANTICENINYINSWDIDEISRILQQMDKNSDSYRVLSCNLWQTINNKNTNLGQNNIIFKDNINRINNFYKEFVIQRNDNNTISIPYRYIIPYNVSIVNDLQNNTSYYTDIGYIWYFCLFILILGFIYLSTFFHIENWKITNKYFFIFNLHLVSIFAWIIRWVIWSAIVWYWIWLIIWTIISNIWFFWAMLDHKKPENKILIYFIIWIFVLSWTYQLIINFVRISSQWGMVVNYKWNSSRDYKYKFENGRFGWEEFINKKFTRKDIFDMQFGHYNIALEYLKNRKDEDGVMIWGTYMQYFLDNQKNLMWDWLLTISRQWSSDYDLCNFRNRYRAKNVKYIVVDQNIMSIIMWEGNNSLKDRMFGKVDPMSGVLVQDWVFAIYVRMIDNGYMKLNYTSNLASKYALTLSDEEIVSYLSWDINTKTAMDARNKDKTQFRSKMALIRFFPDTYWYSQYLTQKIFVSRMQDGRAIQDIADAYWKIIDFNKVLWYAQKIETSYNIELEKELNTNLTQDEIIVLGQYVSWLSAFKSSNPQNIQQFVSQILNVSFWNNSQYMFFELK